MTRTLHSARRSLRAAQAAGRHVVAAAISAHHRLLVALFAAIDAGATVRIRYTDRHGVVSVRNISPRDLRATNTGDITVRAFDHRDGEDTTFRTDRMTIHMQEEPAMAEKWAAHLAPGDQITLYGIGQTVTRVEQRVGPTVAVFTDYTGDDPWLIDPGKHITTQPGA